MNGAVRLIVAGAGGFGCEVAVYVRDALAAGTLSGELAGFLDDVHGPGHVTDLDLPILGTIDDYRPHPQDRVVIGIGAPADRARVAERLDRLGARTTTLVHPLAYVAALADLGEGAIVAPFATIGPRARVGAHCLINTHAGVGHDVIIGDFSAVSPHAALNGRVVVGRAVLIGSGAVVTPGRRVGDGAQVSAGTVVQSDVAADMTVWGNPARPVPRPPQG